MCILILIDHQLNILTNVLDHHRVSIAITKPKPSQSITMTHPFLVDQTAYLPRRELSSAKNSHNYIYKHTSRASTSSTSSNSSSSSRSPSPSTSYHACDPVSEPRSQVYQSRSYDLFHEPGHSSSISFESQPSTCVADRKESKTQEQLEKEKKRERRKGIIFNTY